jgi:hypothetical protein
VDAVPWIGPPDPRLPGGGGEAITLYNLDDRLIGRIDNFSNHVVNSTNAGRTVTGGQTSSGSINVNLLAPNSIFQPYYKSFDVRFAKSMTSGRARIVVLAEFENILNQPRGMSSTLSVRQSYGSTTRRAIRFGVQFRR